MTLRKWLALFVTTLVIGGLAGLASGIAMMAFDDTYARQGFSAVGYNLASFFLGGMMFSIFSQMGFFAYLMLNYIAISIFRKRYWWNMLQVLLTALAVFELSVIRTFSFGGTGADWRYLAVPLLLVAGSVGVAYLKAKATNSSAWIPTLFFMIALTAAESVPSLRQNNGYATLNMMLPLFVCNAWQILRLHRLVGSRTR